MIIFYLYLSGRPIFCSFLFIWYCMLGRYCIEERVGNLGTHLTLAIQRPFIFPQFVFENIVSKKLSDFLKRKSSVILSAFCIQLNNI